MGTRIKAMWTKDVLVILGFMVFLWLTMGLLLVSILAAVGHSPVQTILVVIGILTLVFATVSLVVLLIHLRRNREEIYTEELRHADPEAAVVDDDAVDDTPLPSGVHAHNRPCGAFVKIFDILFVMVLCFLTLLATMLLRGKTVNNAGIYAVQWGSVLLLVLGFVGYFLYLLLNSHRELKLMVDELYADDESAGERNV